MCHPYRLQIGLYIDNELRDPELSALESHLAKCVDCRAVVNAEQCFLDDLHFHRPLYSASPDLRLRVEELLQGWRDSPKRHGLWRQIGAVMRRMLVRPATSPSPMLPAAAAFALIIAVLAGAWIVRGTFRRSDPHSEFAAVAVQLHQRRLHGKLPLQTHSSSPAAISAWFQGKVAFKVDLPSYADMPGRTSPYQIEGATLVSYGSNPAGYIAYRTADRPVSLVTLPTAIAPPLRGKGVVMGKLTIFYDSVDGFHVITWSGPRSRLTYALVSDLEHPSQACILCHASSNSKDLDLMRTLNQQ